jgi:aspartyl-tRNA(Asn)/glutamyl-tRNA(Gln) amidotransferase subunit B
MGWIMKVKIGLETHVQLNSRSKIFCGCRNPVNLRDEPEPNTLTCPTCLGLPGSKPRANEAVIGMAAKVALALNCKVSEETFFSRKTYFYPDMPRNFQITQYEIPLGRDGFVEIETDNIRKKIRIRRVHMEEDPAKIVHVGGFGAKYTLVDYNRSGIPLIEVVTEPDFTSPKEARSFLSKLIIILEYLGVYDPLSSAVVKTDANISLSGGERIEVKNITGTKEIEMALNYEIVRQGNILTRGGKIVQATRMWNPEMKTTIEMRTKETEEDYGYIFEPDLARIYTPQKALAGIRREIPELPDEKYRRFVKHYGVSPKIAESLVAELDIADLFESVAKKTSSKLAGSWIAGYLRKTLNWNGLTFRESGIKPEWVLETVKMFGSGKLTDRNAEMVLRRMVEDRLSPNDVIKKHNIGTMIKITVTKKVKSDAVIKKILTEKMKIDDSVKVELKQIEDVIKAVLDKNKKAVEDYLAGEEKALHFLVGLCMRELKGRVDANTIKRIILKIIK